MGKKKYKMPIRIASELDKFDGKGVIYKFTNTVNGRIYIGQTTQLLDTRVRKHIDKSYSVNDNNYFHNAIRKHGPEKFTYEIIDTSFGKKIKA